ncbi:uncharacterized protein [Diadema antillarum]|uniref:uncharacterized protein n=1 Tax=Diadema antillarum TaxID=105358 RepID=UPI003A86A7F7
MGIPCDEKPILTARLKSSKAKKDAADYYKVRGAEEGTTAKTTGTPFGVVVIVATLVLVIVGMILGIALYIYYTERIYLGTGETRIVTSPCFPSEDDSPVGNTFVVIAPEGYRVKVHFDEFRFDDIYFANRLLIGNGDTPRAVATVISSFQGWDLPPDLVSRDHGMWLEMFSTYVVVNGAFNATFTAVTDEEADIGCMGTDRQCRYAQKCFTEQQQCDGDYECPSGTDEIGCPCLGQNDFKCDDGKCISRIAACNEYPSCDDDQSNCTFACPAGFNISSRFVCDGKNDCGDYSDEMQDCPCDGEQQYLCDNGQCIFLYNKCDAFQHCSDGSDEVDCVCQSWQFECATGSACIPFWDRCDGNDTCADGSDELNCEDTCPGNFFSCPNKLCVPASYRCDGAIDCYNGEDEENCPTPEPCAEGEFACVDGQCLRSSLRCDGVEQCTNGEDEEPELCGTEPVDCFECQDGDCIPTDWVCDGYTDCIDNDDEQGCPDTGEPECEEGYSPCPNRSCIGNEFLCNGITDCPGGSDETSNCTNVPDRCSVMSEGDYFVCDGKEDCPGGADEQNCACGTRPIAMSRIFGGRPSTKGYWPWQILLSGYNHSGEAPICGGTLLNRRWVLTAGHCLPPHSIRNRYIIAGIVDLDANDTSTWQSRLVYDVIWHPMFNINIEKYVEHDLALVLVDKPFDFNDYVQPACLPDTDFRVEPGTYVTTTGWGQTKGGRRSRRLQEGRVPVWPADLCDMYHFINLEQAKRSVCVGYEQGVIGPCFGDSGGPLSVERNDTWYSIGIVSSGIACGAPYTPTLFTNVAYYSEWISNIINLEY